MGEDRFSINTQYYYESENLYTIQFGEMCNFVIGAGPSPDGHFLSLWSLSCLALCWRGLSDIDWVQCLLSPTIVGVTANNQAMER